MSLKLSQNTSGRSVAWAAKRVPWQKRMRREKMPRDRAKELSGKRFGLLTVLYRVKHRDYHNANWLCRCDCGGETVVCGNAMMSGHTSSCGCRRNAGTHRLSNTPTYLSWFSMIQRCTRPTHVSFRDYGDRGITVCEAWRHSFQQFFADMGLRPSGTTIERKDNDKGYYKGNCVWADARAQARNRRSNRFFNHNGQSKILPDWAKLYSKNVSTVRGRIRRGWNLNKALTISVKTNDR